MKAQSEYRYTDSEKIGFAFHKLAGFDPNFTVWIHNSDKYKEAGAINRSYLMYEEQARLQNGYANYALDKHFFDLELPIKVEIEDSYYEAIRKKDHNIISFKAKDIINDYFPVQVGDMWVAVVLKDYEDNTTIAMDNEAFKSFADRFQFSVSNYVHSHSTEANMDLVLKPVSVDLSEPIVVEGIEMWLMLAEILELKIWKKKENNVKRYLFERNADGHLSSEQEDLMLLFKK